MNAGCGINDFETNLNKALTETFDSVLRYEEQQLKSAAGVSVAEAHILEAVGEKPDGTTASEIASALGFAPPTITVAVKKLEQKGYVTKRVCSEDARRSYICLTDSGKRVYRAHGLFHRRMVRNVSRIFTDDEKTVLLAAVNKLHAFFADRSD